MKHNNPGAKTNQTGQKAQTEQKRGGAGKVKEDGGGEGRTYRIRVAIVLQPPTAAIHWKCPKCFFVFQVYSVCMLKRYF